MLCDGDCGNCYHYKDLNLSCDGHWMCNDCMFTLTAEQEAFERDEKPRF